MAKQRVDTSQYTDFEQVSGRLDEILKEVKRKDLPLESSLKLYEEAVALGSKAVDLIDVQTATLQEIEAVEGKGPQVAEDGASAKAEDGVGEKA